MNANRLGRGKTTLAKLARWVGLAARVALGLGGLPAAAAVSFNLTNTISSGVAYVGYPTNAAGINTGTSVSVVNETHAGFYLTCQPVNFTNSGTLTISLVRSWVARPPATYYDTNSWTTNTDFESGGAGITLTVTVPSQTNVFSWYTNLPEWQVGDAQWIGVWSVTNGLPGSSLANFNAGLATKITPIRYP